MKSELPRIVVVEQVPTRDAERRLRLVMDLLEQDLQRRQELATERVIGSSAEHGQ